MPSNATLNSELLAFESNYSTEREDEALATRGKFLKAFPISRLKNLTLDDYVIGKGTASFCASVEAKTKAWAVIQGSTASKFGIYYGRTKSDPTRKYRFTKKYGRTEADAFKNVKAALLKLLQDGDVLDFQAIDANPLSQMFKAKILSLYFPEKFLNVCSGEHIEMLALELGNPECDCISEYQHLLAAQKKKNSIAGRWSNPKYMQYLYQKYFPKTKKTSATGTIKKPKAGTPRRINFNDLQEGWEAVGKKSEAYALAWEKSRLAGSMFPRLAEKIDDRRSRPGYGYDFRSYNAPGKERYIEVKSVGKEKGGYRFFLSENERAVSESSPCRDSYYFYLVFYGSDGEPERLDAILAADLYKDSTVAACAYRVRFSRDK